MTILLWGPASDEPLAAVGQALAGLRAPVFRLDPARLAEARIDLVLDAGGVSGSLRLGEETLSLDTVHAVYPRSGDLRALVARGADAETLARAQAIEATLAAWTEVTQALVISRFSAMASNSSKPYQARLIRAFGFETPDTLLTTDKSAAEAFRTRHGAVVYKSISGVRSIVSQLTDGSLDRLDEAVACPVQFQVLVPGTDVRVHVVGEEVFACEIASDAVDYRYPDAGGPPGSGRGRRPPTWPNAAAP